MPSHDLAVIIVHYKVKAFLHFCLESLYAAQQDLNIQIIVVDNASNDGSIAFFQKVHPEVVLIENETNNGFAKACNQGLALADARYILFLNPDTIISESTLTSCISYYNAHPDTGAIGARMNDGSGQYLPESKRGKVSLWNAFSKQIGLYQFFPKSAFFNGYYLGHLDERNTQEVDVLTGAFFFTTSALLDKIGSFDEDYFMYGEDVDLSYRVRQKGHSLIYLPKAEIIHFKGESTKKSTWRYFDAFYGSMKTFANKHYEGGSLISMRLLLNIGIVISALIGFVKRLVSHIIRPLMDIGIIAGVLFTISRLWAHYYHNDPLYFDTSAFIINLVSYTAIWSSILMTNGAYTSQKSPKKNISIYVKSLVQGFILILMIYALLGNHLRSSRAIIILSFAAIIMVLLLMQWIILRINHRNQNNAIIIHGKTSTELRSALDQYGYDHKRPPTKSTNNHLFVKGKETFTEIIHFLNDQPKPINAIFWDNDQKISISSTNKNERGTKLLKIDLYQITAVHHRWNKRTFDLISGFLMMVTMPFYAYIISDGGIFFKNIMNIIKGQTTLFSYSTLPIAQHLPQLKKGYFPLDSTLSNEEQILQVKEYALHYTVMKDITLLLSHFRNVIKHLSSNG